jgi:hypothetical protein
MTGPEALQTGVAAGGAGNFTPWFALEQARVGGITAPKYSDCNRNWA